MSAETPGSTTGGTPARHDEVAGRPDDGGGDGPPPDGPPTEVDPAAAAEPAADTGRPGGSGSTAEVGGGATPDDGGVVEPAPEIAGDTGRDHLDDLDEAGTRDDLDEIRTDDHDEPPSGDTDGGADQPVRTAPPMSDAGGSGSPPDDTTLGATDSADAVGEEPGSGADEWRSGAAASADAVGEEAGFDDSVLGATAPADVIGDETLIGATAPAEAIDETLIAEIAPQATVPYGGAAPAGPPTLEQPPVASAPATRRARAGERRPAQQRGLRITQRLLTVSPWSVFKVAVLFYLCTFLVVLVAGTILWNIGRSAGAIDSIEGFITRLGAYGSCVEESDVPEDVAFETDQECPAGEVLVGGFEIDDGVLWRAAAIGGGVLVVAGSIGTVLMVVLLNLLNEVTGGVRHTVVAEPAGRSRRGSTVAARRR
ncbi:MAG: DUF3566 domain-containing protein [Acidimicrobiia bacterium]